MSFLINENPYLLRMMQKEGALQPGEEGAFIDTHLTEHGDSGLQIGTLGRQGHGHLNYSGLLSR